MCCFSLAMQSSMNKKIAIYVVYLHIFLSSSLIAVMHCTSDDSYLWFLLNQPTFLPCQKDSDMAHR